jgi:vitamin B12 transporter
MIIFSMRTALLATAATSLSITTPVLAQDPYDLGLIIVSGGLTPIDAAKYGRAATVITSREIKDRGITSVQDALRAVPGVSINGSGTSVTQVRIRGGEANHTLILIDGIEAAGGDGEYTLSGLETANIERIEVLRGPQSVYYGSNASAGVINIITRDRALGQTLSGSFEVGAGTTATAFMGYRTERGGVSLALSSTDDRGFDESGDGGERDGIRRKTAILSGDVMATEDLKFGFTTRRSDEDYDYDSTPFPSTDEASYVKDDPNPFAQRDEMTAGIFAEYSMMDGRLTQRLAFETTQNKTRRNGGAATETTTDAVKYRLSYGLDGAVTEADHLLNLLVDHQKDASSSNAAYDRKSTSAALEYRATLASGLNIQAGARHDRNSVFNDATTWNVGLSYTLPQSGIRLHASAGTGVVNPTYFELYAAAFGYTGNPNLQPEENRSFDLGATLPLFGDRGTLDITYFNERLTGEISALSTGPGTFTFINEAGDSKRQGAEVSGSVQATDALALRMGYTYIEARNADGSVEVRRPRNELALGLTYDTFAGRGSVSADVRHVSGNYDTQFWTGGVKAKLPAFTTLDVAARYGITDKVDLTGRVTNVFDTETTDVWGYANRGRAIYVGLNARF